MWHQKHGSTLLMALKLLKKNPTGRLRFETRCASRDHYTSNPGYFALTKFDEDAIVAPLHSLKWPQ